MLGTGRGLCAAGQVVARHAGLKDGLGLPSGHHHMGAAMPNLSSSSACFFCFYSLINKAWCQANTRLLVRWCQAAAPSCGEQVVDAVARGSDVHLFLAFKMQARTRAVHGAETPELRAADLALASAYRARYGSVSVPLMRSLAQVCSGYALRIRYTVMQI